MEKFEVVNQEFVNTIIGEAKEAVKSATIEAIELTETKTVVSKEGEETGYTGDFLVVGNGGAAANYIIKRDVFLGMYGLVDGNTYRKNARTLVYKMNKGFSVIPSWNNGQALNSEEQGGYLMIYGEGDFNVCSFEDFAKTYVFVK